MRKGIKPSHPPSRILSTPRLIGELGYLGWFLRGVANARVYAFNKLTSVYTGLSQLTLKFSLISL